jgi:hypothetical protein
MYYGRAVSQDSQAWLQQIRRYDNRCQEILHILLPDIEFEDKLCLPIMCYEELSMQYGLGLPNMRLPAQTFANLAKLAEEAGWTGSFLRITLSKGV